MKLRTLILSAKLRKLTCLLPKFFRITRWISTYEMLRRYEKLRVFLLETNSSIVDAFYFSPSENRQLDNLLMKLESLNSVTKELRRETTSLSDIRDLFDAVIVEFRETRNRLYTNASIILCPLSESAIVKVPQGNSSATSTSER